MADSLDARVQQAIAIAKKEGADDVWATARRSRQVKFTSRAASLEKVQENTSRNLSVSLYVDGRYSSHSTTSLAPDRLKSFIKEAVALTRALQPDPYRKLPDPKLFQGYSTEDLQLRDPSLDKVDTDTRRQLVLTLDEVGRRGGEGVVIDAQGYSTDTHTQGAVASTNGFSGKWEETSIWHGASVSVRDKGDKKPSAGVWFGARHLEDIPAPEAIAAEAQEKARRRLGASKAPSQKSTLVVDPRAGARLLRALLQPASGRVLALGRSCLKDKLGQSIGSSALTLVDDPLIPRGLSSRYFNEEGIAARTMPIIENGVLRSYYLDTYYARKLKMDPTTGSSTNQVVAATVAKGLDALVSDAGSGIYVDSWLGGNSDSTTGDFSFGVSGHLIKNGKLAEPINEMNITGNLLALFARLKIVGNDPWPYRNTRVGTMVFEAVDFSGA